MALVGFKSLPLPVSQLSLAAVLKCGQSFRWSIFEAPPAHAQSLEPGLQAEYRFCLKDRVVCLRQSPTTLYYKSVYPEPQPTASQLAERDADTLKWLHDYFQLKVDLVSLYNRWASADKVFAGFKDRFEGIRILRQDPWENLISFICSANNNISRITKMVQNLALHYSPALLTLPGPFDSSEVHTYHPFPPPSALCEPNVAKNLRELGFGYRADYIHRTSKMLAEKHGVGHTGLLTEEPSVTWLRGLRSLTTSEAREELLKFVGVGRKVADCVLLMSLDKKEVVPVDTHVHQIAIKYYGMKGSTKGKPTLTPKVYETLNEKFFTIWGDYAGWAHTVLFTADLKSFASYGTDSEMGSPGGNGKLGKEKSVHIPVPDLLPVPVPQPSKPKLSPLKRKMTAEDDGSATNVDGDGDIAMSSMSQLCVIAQDSLSLAERVKKRRRF